MRNIFSIETVRVQNEARRGIFLFGRLVYIGKKPLYYLDVDPDWDAIFEEQHFGKR